MAKSSTPPHWYGGPLWIQIKKYGNGHSNSKPVGRRKTRTLYQIIRALSETARQRRRRTV